MVAYCQYDKEKVDAVYIQGGAKNWTVFES